MKRLGIERFHRFIAVTGLSSVVLLIGAACAPLTALLSRTVQIQRTMHGVAHIEAPDYESLAYGVAYAHAQDNVCQTADHLLTIRGERSKFFGPAGQSLLGLRPLPNDQIEELRALAAYRQQMVGGLAHIVLGVR